MNGSDIVVSENRYFNVVTPLDISYAILGTHIDQGDTRAHYLMSFELRLSSALRGQSLFEMEDYKKQKTKTPMPSDPYEKLRYEEFRGWMILYENVMRGNGLIDTKQPDIMRG